MCSQVCSECQNRFFYNSVMLNVLENTNKLCIFCNKCVSCLSNEGTNIRSKPARILTFLKIVCYCFYVATITYAETVDFLWLFVVRDMN